MTIIQSLIEERSCPVPECGCWLWLGTTCSNMRYGAVKILGRRVLAHRLSYEAFVAPIPEGLLVCHHCDTPECVNPSHLFVDTIADNNRDRQMKGRYIGEWNGRAKLTHDQVREIRSRIAGGEKIKTLARIMGIDHCALRNVAKGKSWRNVA